MTAGNQPSSSGCGPALSSPGTADAFLIVKRGLFFRPNCQGYTGIRDEAGRYSEEAARYHAEHGECTLIHADDAPEFMPAAYSDLVIKHLTLQRDEMRREVERLRGVAQGAPNRGALIKLIANAYNEGFGEGIREHTSSKGGWPWNTRKQKYGALLDKALALPSTTCAGAATKHSGTFLGYRDEHGNEMHCAHAFCPHQAKCHKGCTNPVAMTSTNRDGFGNKLCPKCSLPHSEFADCPAMAPAQCKDAAL